MVFFSFQSFNDDIFQVLYPHVKPTVDALPVGIIFNCCFCFSMFYENIELRSMTLRLNWLSHSRNYNAF